MDAKKRPNNSRYSANHLIGLITHCKVCYAAACYIEEFLQIY